MPQIYSRRGFTRKDLIATLVVLAIVVGVLLSAIENFRERSRRNACMNNLKEIGLGLHNFYDANKFFPPSADLRSEGPKKTAGGWSFLFRILPNLEYDTIYSSINPADIKSTTIDPLTNIGTGPLSDNHTRESEFWAKAIGIAPIAASMNSFARPIQI